MSTIHFGRKARFSGRALREKLAQAGYSGPDINFGYGNDENALNSPQALELAVNKRSALETLRANEVPIPRLYPWYGLGDRGGGYSMFRGEAITYPVVGRPDKHSKGRYFYMCHSYEDVQAALTKRVPATHFLQYIEGAREFRVHVMRDHRSCTVSENMICNESQCTNNKYRTIKISEKVGDVDMTSRIPRNHRNGIVFNYTNITDNTRSKLRKAARGAVKALGLDFGAVDILLKDDQVYVLEVNTAPCLTDETSDTLQKYADAFMRYWND